MYFKEVGQKYLNSRMMVMICENFVKNIQELPRTAQGPFIKTCVFTALIQSTHRNEGGTS